MRRFYDEVWEVLPEGLEPPLYERRRAFLLSHVRPGDRVLDLGCGEGAFCGELARAGAEPIGMEIAPAALERARRRHPGLRFELTAAHGPIPLEDSAVDVVWSSEVIEHVPDTARWLSEVRRVLRSGGRLLLTTPYHGPVKNLALALRGFERHFDPLGEHLRFYTPRSLRTLLDDFGFDDVAIRTAGGPPLLRELMLARALRAGV
jgi:SAM-dependent methyltransferase